METNHTLENEEQSEQPKRGKRRPKKNIGEQTFNSSELEDADFEEMEGSFIPPENSGNGFSPLDGDVKQRDYTKTKGINDNTPEYDRVPEPTILNIPPPPTNDGGNDSYGSNSQSNQPEKKQPEKLNPDLEGKTPAEVKEGAKMMVNMVLQGYSLIWNQVGQAMRVSDDKIREWSVDGYIDFEMQVPVSQTETVTPKDFYEDYNKQVVEIFAVSDEFMNDVRPPMIREFSKRGWGASDMQYIIFAFVKDSGTKALAAKSLKDSINNLTDQLAEMTKQNRLQYQAQMQYQAQQQSPTPPPVQQPTEKLNKEPVYTQERDNDIMTKLDAKEFIEELDKRFGDDDNLDLKLNTDITD